MINYEQILHGKQERSKKKKQKHFCVFLSTFDRGWTHDMEKDIRMQMEIKHNEQKETTPLTKGKTMIDFMPQQNVKTTFGDRSIAVQLPPVANTFFPIRNP